GYDVARDSGSIFVTPMGGVEPYTYQWDDANMSTEKDLTNVPEDTYSVVITDANGCSSTFEFVLDQTTSTEQLDITSFSVSLRPNYLSRGTQAVLNFDNTQAQQVRIELFDQLGRMLRSERQQLATGRNQFNFESPAAAGLYFLRITSEARKVKTIKLVVD
ncbi:MAG: T9SS type A sorting domain-containing protein, partial [Bacteroidota bacterium]